RAARGGLSLTALRLRRAFPSSRRRARGRRGARARPRAPASRRAPGHPDPRRVRERLRGREGRRRDEARSPLPARPPRSLTLDRRGDAALEFLRELAFRKNAEREKRDAALSPREGDPA